METEENEVTRYVYKYTKFKRGLKMLEGGLSFSRASYYWEDDLNELKLFKLSQATPEDVLLKYRTLNDIKHFRPITEDEVRKAGWSKEIIEKFKCIPPPKQLELIQSNINNKEIQENVRNQYNSEDKDIEHNDLVKYLDEKLRICSLCEFHNVCYMWGTYAENATGFCFKINYQKLMEYFRDGDCRNVEYRDNFFEYNKFMKLGEIDKIIFPKSKRDFEQEKEIRLVLTDDFYNDGKNEGRFNSVDVGDRTYVEDTKLKDYLEGVIVGEHCVQENIDKVKEVLRQDKYKHVQLQQMANNGELIDLPKDDLQSIRSSQILDPEAELGL